MGKNKKMKVYSCALLTGMLIVGESLQFSVNAKRYDNLQIYRYVVLNKEMREKIFALIYAERIAAGNNVEQATSFATNYANVYLEGMEAGDTDKRATIFATIYAERRAAGDNPQQAGVYAKRTAR